MTSLCVYFISWFCHLETYFPQNLTNCICRENNLSFTKMETSYWQCKYNLFASWQLFVLSKNSNLLLKYLNPFLLRHTLNFTMFQSVVLLTKSPNGTNKNRFNEFYKILSLYKFFINKVLVMWWCDISIWYVV